MRSVLRVAFVGSGIFFAPLAHADEVCAAPRTHCASTDGYYAPDEDVTRVTAVTDPVLRELGRCFASAGAKDVPNVTIRWDSDGKPVSVTLDTKEKLPCVAKARQKLATLENPHETSIRCEYGCAPPPAAAAPPPVAPPPVAPPPPPPAVVAPPPPYSAAHATPDERAWYGWQNLLVDAAAIGIFVGGWAVDDGDIVGAGWVTFLFGSPIVHWAHGNVGKGFGAFGFNLGIPIAGFLVGGMFGFGAGEHGSGAFRNLGPHSNGPVVGATVGGAIGTVVAAALDAGILAWTKPKEQGISWFPKLDLRPGHASATIGGTF